MRMPMKRNLFQLLGMGSSLLFFAPVIQAQRNKLPNVIFILADDIGYGDLSCNGEPTIHTPQVEKLAAAGLRFTNAHATAATSTPSRYSLLTGLYAWRRNDTEIAAGDAGMVIRPEQPTIADMFRECGYATGAVGKWHLGLGDTTGSQDWNGFITPGPSDIGFDYSYIMAATGDRVPCVYVENQRVVNLDPDDPLSVSYTTPFPGEPLGKDHPELLTVLKPSPRHGHDMAIVNGISRIGYMKGGKKALWNDETIADSITVKAVQFIEHHKDHPFFLYFATNDIHVPRVPHPRFRGKTGMGARGDALMQFDWSVGEIMQALDRLGLTDNTLIVLTSDNGPVVDDGYQDRAVELLGEHRPGGPFRGGKYSIFEAGTRIPFLISWPRHIAPGSVSDALVSQIDLFASLAKMTGKKLAKGVASDSREHWDAFTGKDKKGRAYIVEQAKTLAVFDGYWKYIVPSNKSPYNKLTRIELGNSKQPQLYNISQETAEQENLAAAHPEIVKRLNDLLEKEKKKVPAY